MNYYDNQRMYESIMRDIAPIVKRRVNEAVGRLNFDNMTTRDWTKLSDDIRKWVKWAKKNDVNPSIIDFVTRAADKIEDNSEE